MISLCLSASALTVALSTQTFTLAWMHSVEKIRWEEDWKIEDNHLYLLKARIKGSGAGMEPPLDSVFHNGAWHYTPHIAPLQTLLLAHSSYTTEYELCVNFTCKPISQYFPNIEKNTTITLEACER